MLTPSHPPLRKPSPSKQWSDAMSSVIIMLSIVGALILIDAVLEAFAR